MGLSICRFIGAHGGRLWANTNASRGAVFRFTVPGEEKGTHPRCLRAGLPLMAPPKPSSHPDPQKATSSPLQSAENDQLDVVLRPHTGFAATMRRDNSAAE
jgi:hypothetical protein